MTENIDRYNQLLEKLETLMKKQESVWKEIDGLKSEINRLKIEGLSGNPDKEETKEAIPVQEEKVDIKKEVEADPITNIPLEIIPLKSNEEIREDKKPASFRMETEKFIGENLINKIGIVITIIGVAIGAKYAIDHQLISPLTRIIFGYLMGAGLLLFALKLKKEYNNFSAVLLSGSMAIMYFITYAAYSFYQLFPQLAAFILMVIFTVFTVTSAINYNKQIIAHIGLVGAYAVPFLLSEGTGNIMILFSYTAIINVGILVIAFKKYWKLLYYSSFLITWLLYMTWFLSNYQNTDQLTIAFLFLSIFFVTFYMMFLAYKLLQKEKFDIYDIILLLLNSFILYGSGYRLLYFHDIGEHYLGLYTFGNALVHLIVSIIIYRQKLADRNLFYMVSGLVLVFITIAVPVQLNGNWVTLLWAGEAVVLFWIGRTRKVQIYEVLSYILMILAFLSIVQDWAVIYLSYIPGQAETRITPIININFLSALLFIAAFSYINMLNRNKKYPTSLVNQHDLLQAVSFTVPAILIITAYVSVSKEITTYFNQLYQDSLIEITKPGLHTPTRYWNYDLTNFKTVWMINYSLLFFSIMAYINVKKISSRNLGIINLSVNLLILLIFLTIGLYSISELRETYLNHSAADLYYRSIFNIIIRYVSFVFAGIMIYSIYLYIRQNFLKPSIIDLNILFDILLTITVIWVLSSELINWMNIMQSTQSYKLGLSILWGVYSVLLIVLGIWKKKQHLRIAAIVLFGATLLKLFFYDITSLDTISKTIVFVTLGILLLIISFLYNKYRNLISDNEE